MKAFEIYELISHVTHPTPAPPRKERETEIPLAFGEVAGVRFCVSPGDVIKLYNVSFVNLSIAICEENIKFSPTVFVTPLVSNDQ